MMKIKPLLLSLALLFPTGLIFGQSPSLKKVNKESLVSLSPFQKSRPLPHTDSMGLLYLKGHGSRGTFPFELYKYNSSTALWEKVDNAQLVPLIIAGRTDLTAVREHSLIHAVYWKGGGQSFWALAAKGEDLISPKILQLFWTGQNHGNQVEKGHKKVWLTLCNITLEY